MDQHVVAMNTLFSSDALSSVSLMPLSTVMRSDEKEITLSTCTNSVVLRPMMKGDMKPIACCFVC